MSATYYTIEIPCKPYIYKYIVTIFGELIIADTKSSIGMMMMLSLSKEIYRGKFYNNGHEFTYDNCKHSIKVGLTKFQFDNFGSDISRVHIAHFNNFFESWFEEQLFCFVQDKLYNDTCDIKEALHAFASRYNIILDADVNSEPDISYEGLKKKEYRYRKGKSKSPKVLPFKSTITKGISDFNRIKPLNNRDNVK